MAQNEDIEIEHASAKTNVRDCFRCLQQSPVVLAGGYVYTSIYIYMSVCIYIYRDICVYYVGYVSPGPLPSQRIPFKDTFEPCAARYRVNPLQMDKRKTRRECGWGTANLGFSQPHLPFWFSLVCSLARRLCGPCLARWSGGSEVQTRPFRVHELVLFLF